MRPVIVQLGRNGGTWLPHRFPWLTPYAEWAITHRTVAPIPIVAVRPALVAATDAIQPNPTGPHGVQRPYICQLVLTGQTDPWRCPVRCSPAEPDSGNRTGSASNNGTDPAHADRSTQSEHGHAAVPAKTDWTRRAAPVRPAPAMVPRGSGAADRMIHPVGRCPPSDPVRAGKSARVNALGDHFITDMTLPPRRPGALFWAAWRRRAARWRRMPPAGTGCPQRRRPPHWPDRLSSVNAQVRAPTANQRRPHRRPAPEHSGCLDYSIHIRPRPFPALVAHHRSSRTRGSPADRTRPRSPTFPKPATGEPLSGHISPCRAARSRRCNTGKATHRPIDKRGSRRLGAHPIPARGGCRGWPGNPDRVIWPGSSSSERDLRRQAGTPTEHCRRGHHFPTPTAVSENDHRRPQPEADPRLSKRDNSGSIAESTPPARRYSPDPATPDTPPRLTDSSTITPRVIHHETLSNADDGQP